MGKFTNKWLTKIRRRLILGAVMLGLAGSQLGCGCECAVIPTAAAAVSTVIMMARESREARKTELEIKQLEAARGCKHEHHETRSDH